MFPAVRPSLQTEQSVRIGGLPATVSSFVGREEELAVLEPLLEHHRLVTLTGPGGSGKTRLALELAERVREGYAGGAWFVDLAPIRDPELALAAIAAALRVRRPTGRALLEALVERLTQSPTLLLLDNLEQLAGAAQLAADLLARCRVLRVLGTSRAPLHVRGEQEFRVDPLALPDSSATTSLDALLACDAIRLFVERARSVTSRFALTPDNAGAVAGICRRLDGLPLAIELAAARTALLAPEALLRRLEIDLSLLRYDAADAPARQRTILQTIAWSHELLEAADRRVFARCSVFAGSFSVAAAEAVVPDPGDDHDADILEALGRLVDRNLLRVEADDAGEPRFRLLETVREFGAGQLAPDERRSLRERHAGHFLDVAERARTQFGARDQLMPREDLDNFRAALVWAEEPVGQAEVLIRLAIAVAMIWGQMGGQMTECGRWLQAAEKVAEEATPRLRAAFRYERVRYELAFGGDRHRAERLLLQNVDAFEQLGDRTLLGRTWFLLSDIAADLDDRPLAVERAARGLEITRAESDTAARARLLAHAAQSQSYVRTPADAFALGEEALELAREVNDWPSMIDGLLAVGCAALAMGDARFAIDPIEQAVEMQRRVGRDLMVGVTDLALARLRIGDLEGSHALCLEALALSRRFEAFWFLLTALEICADWLGASGQHAASTTCWAAIDAHRAIHVDRTYFDDVGAFISSRERDRAALSDRAYAEAHHAGSRMALSAAIDFATQAMESVPAASPADRPLMRFGSDQLTAREHEVLQLVAAGHTDGQIAAALFISKKTAAVHVSNIKSKLGAGSRVEIVTIAHQRGLVPIGRLLA